MNHEVRAKKHLGQHFLKDENIARKIADLTSLFPHVSHWLEVGPGTGMLTRFLIENHIPLTLCEIDGESVEYLKKQYSNPIITRSFLDISISDEFPNGVGVIGNFPYNISSQIVFQALDHQACVPVLAGMFQKEMAQRIAAPEGGKDYGILSVLAQAFYEVKYRFTVSEHVFIPPPKVKSGVITMARKVHSEVIDEPKFRDWVKTAFQQRRKTLRNTLRSKVDPSLLSNPIFDRRPESLSVTEWIKFVNGDFF